MPKPLCTHTPAHPRRAAALPPARAHGAFYRGEAGDSPALPAAMCSPSGTKVILYLRKGGVMRKTSRYRVLRLEGKCWASQGRPERPAQKPLCPPTPTPAPDNGTERNYLFSGRLSRRPSPGWLVSMRLGGWRLGGRPPPSSGPGVRLGDHGRQHSWGQRTEPINSPASEMPSGPKLQMKTLRPPSSCPCPRLALSGVPGWRGPPCLGKARGLGHPGWHQMVSPPGDPETSLLRSPARWAPPSPCPALFLKLPVSVPDVSKTGGWGPLPAPAPSSLLRKPFLAPGPRAGVPGAGLCREGQICRAAAEMGVSRCGASLDRLGPPSVQCCLWRLGPVGAGCTCRGGGNPNGNKGQACARRSPLPDLCPGPPCPGLGPLEGLCGLGWP